MLVSLERLAAAYRGALGEWVYRLLVAVGISGLLVAGFVARFGSLPSRLLGWLVLVSAIAGSLSAWWREGRGRASEEEVIRDVLVPAETEQGLRVLRAFKLASRTPLSNVGESQELARVHYERLLGRFSIDSVTNYGARRARRLRLTTWLVVGAALGAFGFAPLHVAEGLNVLVARAGRAPVDMQWLDETIVYSQPPAYLGPQPTQLMMQSASSLPEGSVISVRGRPLRPDRHLVLSDGTKEVPFANDGAGAQVAHWPVESSSVLRVAARFGEVLIFSPDVLEVHAQADEVPRVRLEGAPQAIDLASMQRLELRWRASDDHALAQVDLVLRSGGKEERRPLEHFPGDQASGEGGHVLFPSDPFLQRIFLPVVVRIEARDNDSRAGSKWGASEAFTLRPTIPGAPEAERYRGIASVRDNLVRFLGQRLEDRALPPAERNRAALRAIKELESESLSALSRTYAGLDVPRGWAPFARAQFQRLGRAFERRSEEIRTTEGVVLAIDGGLASLAARDAAQVAKRLGDVAEEAAFGAHLAQQSETDRATGRERLDLAVSVLEQGALELQELGALGRDLGSVSLADLGRVTRSVETSDFLHAELAALHLAARLHRPTPSFSSKGGGGGVESGPGQSGESQDGESGEGSSDADAEFDRLAQDLEQLAEEHAGSLERTAKALEAAKSGLDNEALVGEAKRRAEQLRRSVVALPQPGQDPGTSGASAALAREHAGAMAHELERLALDRALENGTRARAAAEEALRRGDLDSETAQLLRSALQQLESDLAWTEQQLRQRGAETEQAARAPLSELSKAERELSERARRLSAEEPKISKAQKPQAGLPDEAKARLRSASRLMDEAVRALESGKGDEAVDFQRQAQRLLEESETGKTDEPSESTSQPQPQRSGSGGGDVPSADRRNSAQDFRQRVLSGLGKRGTTPLSGAIKRYAEGLLR